MAEKINKSEADWEKELTPEQFYVCRHKGTERPFTGDLNAEHRPGTYYCVACGNKLYEGETKFESGSGWPSFWAPANDTAVETHQDSAYGMRRTEVVCARCSSHLGHVFDDGPEPTGQRYCMNSAAMRFEPAE